MLLFFLLFLTEGPGWTVKIEPIQYEYYPKEPMWFTVIGVNDTERELENLTDEGYIELNGKYCGKIYDNTSLYEIIERKSKPGEKLKYPPKSIKKISFLLEEVCYDAFPIHWGRADEMEEFYGVHNLCYIKKWKEFSREKYEWEEKKEIFCADFKITYPPEGEDRKFYNKYLKESNLDNITKLDESEKLKAIKEFPTAWYTGWIIDRFYPDLAYGDADNFLEELKKPIKERNNYRIIKLSTEEKGIEEIIKIYAEVSEKFLKSHKNHPLNSLIYATLSYEYFYLGDFEKGLKYGENALEGDFPQWYKYFNHDYTGKTLKFLKENFKKIMQKFRKI